MVKAMSLMVVVPRAIAVASEASVVPGRGRASCLALARVPIIYTIVHKIQEVTKVTVTVLDVCRLGA
jgi:hypothetical protein